MFKIGVNNMKKLTLILCVLLIWGCTNKEQTITDANGESQTYQFFINYNIDEYSLKLKNGDSKINIVKTDNKVYYEVINPDNITKIIEKDGYKYTIDENMKKYTVEPIIDLTDYGYGYMPTDIVKLKTQSYRKGEEKIGFTKYMYEEYLYQGGSTTYYFKNNKLKLIKNKTALTKTIVEFSQLSSKINNKVFNLPENYGEITY